MSTLSGTPTRGRLPVAPRDKRPALAALAILLILLGALGSALLVFRSGDRASVLVADKDISFGETIQADDLRSIRVAAEDGRFLTASRLEDFVGYTAAAPMPEGTVVNARMFATSMEALIPEGAENVGVVLDATRRPSTMPRAGDVVKVYFVNSDASSKTGPDNPVLVEAARVMTVGRGSGAGTDSLTLLLSKGDAAKVAEWAARGNVAVTVLPGGETPKVDYAQPAASEAGADEESE